MASASAARRAGGVSLQSPDWNPSPLKPFTEKCWILLGSRQGRLWHARRIKPCRGQLDRVAFDGSWTLAREEQRGDVIGFYHTHPPGMLALSARDVRTMRAWVSSLGKPLLCLVECEGELAGWRFDDDASEGAPLTACELFPRGVVVAVDAVAPTAE